MNLTIQGEIKFNSYHFDTKLAYIAMGLIVNDAE